MRLIGMAERAIELMCRRAVSRTAFGKPLAQQGVVQNWIADARVAVEQLRLLVLKTAWLMDTVGNKGAHTEIQAIKIATPRTVVDILDKAVQLHGAGGVSQDFPLAELWAGARTLKLADGPDEVHQRSLARRELKKYLSARLTPAEAPRAPALGSQCGGPWPCGPRARERRQGRSARSSRSARWSATCCGVSGPSGRYHVDRWCTEPKW